MSERAFDLAVAGGGPAGLARSPFPLEAGLPGVFAAGRAREGAAPGPEGAMEEGIGAARQAGGFLRSLAPRFAAGVAVGGGRGAAAGRSGSRPSWRSPPLSAARRSRRAQGGA